MNKVIIIDNYDSFTYNLVQLVYESIGQEPVVVLNDQFTLNYIEEFEHIILSPGPGLPSEAGLLKDLINKFGPKKKIFGVCLGLQAIGEVYGANLFNLKNVFHGIKSRITVTDTTDRIFENIDSPFEAGRYHSWVIENKNIPENLIITAVDSTGEIMAAKHKFYNVFGVQFHPESIMTPFGGRMMKNFLNL